MDAKTSKILRSVFWALLAVLLLWFSFRGVDWQEFWRVLGSSRWGYVLLAMAAGIFSFIFRSLRWRLLMLPVEPETRRLNCYDGFTIGRLCDFAVPHIGNLVRCGYVLTPRMTYDKALGTVVLERLWDIVMLALIIVILLVFKGEQFGGFFMDKMLRPAAARLTPVNPWLLLAALLLLALAVFFVLHLLRPHRSHSSHSSSSASSSSPSSAQSAISGSQLSSDPSSTSAADRPSISSGQSTTAQPYSSTDPSSTSAADRPSISAGQSTTAQPYSSSDPSSTSAADRPSISSGQSTTAQPYSSTDPSSASAVQSVAYAADSPSSRQSVSFSASPSRKPSVGSRVGRFMNGIVQGFSSFLKMKGKVWFLLLTLLLWTMFFLMSWFIIKALPMDFGFTFADALFIMLVGSLAGIVPVPGGFGAFHYIVALALQTLYAIPFETGLIFATLSHESQAVTVILCGLLSYARQTLSRRPR